MYKTFLVTYELTNKAKDYNAFYEELKKTDDWWHYIEASWLLKTGESNEALLRRLATHIDKDDRLLIVDITSNKFAGSMPDEAWEWDFFTNAPKKRLPDLW
ncbi:MAG: hypothetical protein PHI59_01265 [Candidatus Omnitrophica bacterium]|nr:hypothetical protein [Candidatus Omnitrophota bacterium]